MMEDPEVPTPPLDPLEPLEPCSRRLPRSATPSGATATC